MSAISNIWKIKIISYDCGLLDNFVQTLINNAKTLMVNTKTIFLPVKNKRFALLNSSFIYSKSKMHIGIATHSRAIYLDLGSRNISIFKSLQIPTGVSIELKKVNDKRSNK